MRACRTCLTKKDLNPLFGDLSAVKFTSKQLYLATGIPIGPNDNLPQEACKSCIKQIKRSLEFRYISNKTNIYLRQILKNVKYKSEIINISNWTDYEDPERYFESSEVKLEHYHLQDSDIDNNETDNSQFDNSHNYIDNKQVNNSHIDYQKNHNRNDEIQPDNENKYLDNKKSDDTQRNCNKSQFDNYNKSHKYNSQLNKHHDIDNKLLSDSKTTKEHIARTKSQKTKQSTKKSSKNMIQMKFAFKKLKTHDNKSNSDSCIDLSPRINIKIEDYEADSKKSEISNKSSNEQEMASKQICNDKQKRNKLMSLAVTPYPSEGPVQCRVCNEHLKVTSFMMHAKRHFAPEFTCEVCGKMFRSHAHMVYHQQRMHGREKRLACNLCDFRTVDRLKLKNHERGHSGERPYVCDECGASFRMRTNIVQHMRTHFGVRNIQCELCANLFRSKSELANHKNKVHNKLTYLCYLCPQTYKGKRAVRRHLMNLHGVLEDQILKIKCIKSKKLEEVSTS